VRAAAAEKPAALDVVAEVIPAELRALPQWVVWKFRRRMGMWTKPPSDVKTGRAASSTDPATWATFEETLDAYRRGGWDGIGLIHLPGDNLTGIDLDHVRDPETGELKPWAARIVAEVDSYTEVSPSGAGVCIYAHGRKPDREAAKKGDVEIYDGVTADGVPGGRFLTLTGHRLEGTPSDIRDRQDQIVTVYERELKGAKGEWAVPETVGPTEAHPPGANGAPEGGTVNPFKVTVKWSPPEGPLSDEDIIRVAEEGLDPVLTDYWRGGHNGKPSQSEADKGLCHKLLWWIGEADAARVDRLFRRSGLMREKWNQKHGEKTYGQRTIAKAIAKQTEYRKPKEEGGGDPSKETGFRNFYEVIRKGKKPLRFGFPVQRIEARLRHIGGGWPRRVGNLLFAEAPNCRPLWLERPPQFFAWVSRLLPGDVAQNPLAWADGSDMVSEGRFHAYLAQTAVDYDAIELFPHHPLLPRTYYMHPQPVGGDGAALRELLGIFTPATLVDFDLLKAFFLSLFWGGAPGARPAWLFTSDDDPQGGRGVGKSTVAKLGARLVGGHIDLATNERMTDVITRLLSPDALERRLVLLDNVKSLKFSWAELEALITTDSVSGHRLYHGEGRRPNTLTVCITLNGASLSRDLAKRCVIVKLKRPQYRAAWEEDAIRLIESRRWEIVGDILTELRRDEEPLSVCSRWGAWEGAVLSRVADPSECQKVIGERQEEVDDDTTEADLVRDYFSEQISHRRHDPSRAVLWIDSRTAAHWCNEALNENRPTQRATSYLETLGITELRYSRRGDRGRGWTWRGRRSTPGEGVRNLNDPDPFAPQA
jgi:hypothetical protein